MTFSLSRIFHFLLISVISLTILFPQSLFAQDHVVSSSDMQKDLQAASASRQKELAQLDEFFSSAQAQKTLQSIHVSYQQVHKAVHSLSDEDLARISARALQTQNDFAAGAISNRDLIWILVGIAVIILVIVAVR
jgi:hypothetical protein